MSTDMKTQIRGYVSQMEEDQAPIDSAEVSALLKPVREVLPRSAPVRRVRLRGSRRWDFRWVYGIAATVVALLLVGGAALLVREIGLDRPDATSSGDPSSSAPAATEAPVAVEDGGGGAEIGDESGELLSLAAGSVFRIDPETNQVAAVIETTYGAPIVAVGEGTVWVREWEGFAGSTVSQIDPETNRLVRTVGIVGEVMDLAIGEGSVWVTSHVAREGVLVEIDAESGRVRRTIDLGYSPLVVSVEGNDATSMPVAVGAGAVWVAATGPEGDVLLRIEPTTAEVVEAIPLSDQAIDVAVAAGGVWLIGTETEDSQVATGIVWRIDPATNAVVASVAIPDPEGYVSVATGAGAVWVNSYSGPLLRINPATNVITETPGQCHGGQHLDCPHGDGGIAVGSGSVWITDNENGTIKRFDLATGVTATTLRRTGSLGPCTCSVAIGAVGVWAS